MGLAVRLALLLAGVRRAEQEGEVAQALLLRKAAPPQPRQRGWRSARLRLCHPEARAEEEREEEEEKAKEREGRERKRWGETVGFLLYPLFAVGFTGQGLRQRAIQCGAMQAAAPVRNERSTQGTKKRQTAAH